MILRTFLNVLKIDLLLLFEKLKDNIINALVWGGSTFLVTMYVFPKLGFSTSIAAYQSVSIIISVINFQLYGQVFNLTADMEGNRHIDYYFTLPIPNWLILLRIVIVFAVGSFILALLMLPLAKLVLMENLNLLQVNYGYFLLTLMMVSTFFGTFSLFCMRFIEKIDQLGNVIMRVMFPLWYLGGFQFSWKTIHGIAPVLSYVNLLNPYVYCNEAIRSAMLPGIDCIPFWTNIFALACFTMFCGVFAYKHLKARLDFI